MGLWQLWRALPGAAGGCARPTRAATLSPTLDGSGAAACLLRGRRLRNSGCDLTGDARRHLQHYHYRHRLHGNLVQLHGPTHSQLASQPRWRSERPPAATSSCTAWRLSRHGPDQEIHRMLPMFRKSVKLRPHCSVHSVRCSVRVFFILAPSRSTAFAQSATTGAIGGAVTDSGGALLPGADRYGDGDRYRRHAHGQEQRLGRVSCKRAGSRHLQRELYC